jgi:hypothetical protein
MNAVAFESVTRAYSRKVIALPGVMLSASSSGEAGTGLAAGQPGLRAFLTVGRD